MHRSVATLDSPEFINLQPLDINPLMSKCDIKLLYLGGNRNGTYFTKEVAIEMGKNLRGAPIVGYYKPEKEDYTDHGDKITIDSEGIHFTCETVPYGFVSPDAKVWFQNFQDYDDNGTATVRTYLMTTGYLWTKQFPESSLPVKEGRPSSMELDRDSVNGQWEVNFQNSGMDFFIIDDAIIQKICILGDDVEPCFEGASVTAPNVSSKFTLDNQFKHTLFNMMQDLKNALNEGGQQMDDLNKVGELGVTDPTNTDKPVADYVKKKEDEDKEVNGGSASSASDDNKDSSNDDNKNKNNNSNGNGNGNSNSNNKNNNNDNNSSNDDDNSDDDEDKKKKNRSANGNNYELLESELAELKKNYTTLQKQYEDLAAFKNSIDNQKKDELIAEFYMLSDEDKKDVISNKEKYTLDEIKSKLAVICFDKKVNFTLNDNNHSNINTSTTDNTDKLVTYTLNNDNNANNSLPDWVKAVKEQERLN